MRIAAKSHMLISNPVPKKPLDMTQLWGQIAKYRPLALALTGCPDTADDVQADAFMLIVSRHVLPTQPTTTFVVLSIKEAARKARRFWARHTSIAAMPVFDPAADAVEGNTEFRFPTENKKTGQKSLFRRLPGNQEGGR